MLGVFLTEIELGNKAYQNFRFRPQSHNVQHFHYSLEHHSEDVNGRFS